LTEPLQITRLEIFFFGLSDMKNVAPHFSGLTELKIMSQVSATGVP
jgi:hypothetical protein